MSEIRVRWCDDLATEHESTVLSVDAEGYVLVDHPDPDNPGCKVTLTRAECLVVGCDSCPEPDIEQDECPKSERLCGHHCNCSFEVDRCCWCGQTFGADR